MHNTLHLHGFSILSDSMKFMKFSLKVSLKISNEILTWQNFMKFSISTDNYQAPDIRCTEGKYHVRIKLWWLNLHKKAYGLQKRNHGCIIIIIICHLHNFVESQLMRISFKPIQRGLLQHADIDIATFRVCFLGIHSCDSSCPTWFVTGSCCVIVSLLVAQ